MKIYHGSNVEVKVPENKTIGFCTNRALHSLSFLNSYAL